LNTIFPILPVNHVNHPTIIVGIPRLYNPAAASHHKAAGHHRVRASADAVEITAHPITVGFPILCSRKLLTLDTQFLIFFRNDICFSIS